MSKEAQDNILCSEVRGDKRGLKILLIKATFTGHVTNFRPAENFVNLTNPK